MSSIDEPLERSQEPSTAPAGIIPLSSNISYPSLPTSEIPRWQPAPLSTTPLKSNPAANAHSDSRIPRSPNSQAPPQASPGGPQSSHMQTPPAQPAIRRTASSTSLRSSRSNTPTLLKKTSITSLKNAATNTPPRSPISRRQSSNLPAGFVPITSPRTSLAPAVEEPSPNPPPSPESVAREVLEKEIEEHSKSGTAESDIVVVLHDACYGHRFSRPRTSKAALSTIVERPERALAIVRGISIAYVRLGGRHVGGKYPPHPKAPVPPPPFRLKKSTRKLPLESPAVTQVHGLAWMAELKSMCESAEARLAENGKELVRPPGSNDDAKANEKPELHEGDLYLCSESLAAFEGALGGVCDAVDAVFQTSGPRRAFACVRPPGHHCSSDFPSGFCWLNNVHVGIAHAIQQHGLTHAAIIDFDLHHGDGSQSITWAHNARLNSMHKNISLSKKSPIGYFSLHDINSYPCEYGDPEKVQNASLCIENAHSQSIWNIHLQPWKTEDDFWKLYETRYLVLIEKMRAFLLTHAERLRSAKRASVGKATSRSQEVPVPKAAIFISAGFDASEYEGTGMQRHKVNVPTDFYSRFTRDISRLADEEGLGVDGRIISVLEGGYSDKALTSGILSHICGLTNAYQDSDHSTDSLEVQMSGLSVDSVESPPIIAGPVARVDSKWWAEPCLAEFDDVLKPMAPPAPPGPAGPKKNRTINPTYTTPTQASTAKAVPSRRSLPNQHKHPVPAPVAPPPPPRAPTPPPPDVGWAVAAHELSKLLVPSNRQTTSCKPEDLAAPRQRKPRQSDTGVLKIEGTEGEPDPGNTAGAGKRAGLRERKVKPVYKSDNEDEQPKRSRPASRANRRRTIGVVKSASPSEEAPDVPAIPTAILPFNQNPIAETPIAALEAPVVSSANGDNFLTAPAPLHRTLSEDHVPQQGLAPLQRHSLDGADEVVANGSVNALDSLANGMKKMSIKLNVPSREEHEAREAQRALELERTRHSLS